MKSNSESGHRLDTGVVRRAFDRASPGYDSSAILQEEVRSRLLERLDLVNLDPAVAVDAGCGTGHVARTLLKRYRRCRVIALDLSEGMLSQARKQRHWLRSPSPVCADAARLPLKDGSVDMILSNLMMQWCNDLDALLAEFRRVLRPGGLLSFSTFGPDTLRELRAAWGAADGFVHVSRFLDMHDIGDALVRAGLTEPVLDVDYFCLTYNRVTDLMRDLKAIGASNAAVGRNRGLTGRGRFRAVEAAYDEQRVDGRLPATWEVVYGHAWGTGQSTGTRQPGETTVPLADIGRRPQT